ncbi:alpha/beta hydrolase [Nocardia sp. BMG111209]|uniref:alpha/beta hydrolase n=1 Tax=Nocardia sp. BMG111209 TaxID=1160137 RepID=UPI00037E4F31|nr:alpha/beta hydrolase [Nocardia sp. BMG111209]
MVAIRFGEVLGHVLPGTSALLAPAPKPFGRRCRPTSRAIPAASQPVPAAASQDATAQAIPARTSQAVPASASQAVPAAASLAVPAAASLAVPAATSQTAVHVDLPATDEPAHPDPLALADSALTQAATVDSADIGTVMNPGSRSLSAQALLLACRAMIGPLLRYTPITPLTMPVARAAVDTLARLRPEPAGVEREQVQLPGFRMEIVRPAGARRSLRHGAVLYLHGGGFVICGLETHRPVVAALARRTGLPVVSVDYRQLPDARIQDSIEDCLTAYRWLLTHGANPKRIVIAGDSAGGFLSFAVALRAVADGLPTPAGLVGLSPLLDLDHVAKQSYVNVARDAYIPLPGLQRIVHYGAELDGLVDPALSPVNGPLAGLPPVLMIVGEDELLRYDCELMARRLTAAGVPNTLELWRGQVHAFTSILPGMPESRAALGRVARFVRGRIDEQPAARSA